MDIVRDNVGAGAAVPMSTSPGRRPQNWDIHWLVLVQFYELTLLMTVKDIVNF